MATLVTVTIGEFLDPETGDLTVNLHNLPAFVLGAIKSFEIKRGIDGLGREVTVTKFKLHDRLKAIVAAGNHRDVQAFNERVDLNSDFGAALDAAEARMQKALQ